MKIVVCVKQVPEADKVAIDPETGTLIRDGVASILNPFCEYALDEAVKLKQSLADEDVEVIAISMGPPQAKMALYRCLELGADKAYLLSDRKFAGSDVWATSTAIKEGIKNIAPDYDLIITGKQAIDGDTAQVPAEVAEQLGIPQITYGLETKVENKKIIVKRETERGYQWVEARLPALVTMSRGAPIRRMASIKDLIESRSKTMEVRSADDLGVDENQVGLKASPTQVDKIFPPKSKKGGEIIDGTKNPSEAAQKIYELLIERKFLKEE